MLPSTTTAIASPQTAGHTAPRSPKVAYASELGCALNTSLAHGGGTDDTAILNRFLATASATYPIKLILDGAALISGLEIAPAGHTIIEGLGHDTGFYNAPQNGRIIISNGYPPTTGNSKPPAQTAENVTFRNFYLNGNAEGNTANVVSYGIAIQNCRRLIFEDVRIDNTNRFCSRLDNCSDVHFNRCAFQTGAQLQDGVHLCGPCDHVTVTNCRFATGDDAVAINAPEGFGGDITDVLVSNCFAENCLSFGRVYPSNRSGGGVSYRCKRIVFSKVVGSTSSRAFQIGVEASQSVGSPDQVQDLLIEGCDLASPVQFLQINAPFGSVQVVNCTFRSPTRPVAMVAAAWPGAFLQLANCTILRNQDGNAPAHFLDAGAVGETAIEHIHLSGLRSIPRQGGPGPAADYMLNVYGTVGELRIDGISMEGFRAFLNPNAPGLARVSKVAGGAVLSIGVPIPDALADNGVLYLSASTRKVCVKVAGGVYPII